MRRTSVDSEINSFEYNQHNGSQNWLLHARYVRGEYETCTALADKLLQKTNNTHRYAYFMKGMVLAETGRLQEALEKFHSCIRLQTHDPEPVKQVAKCLYRQGRYQLALEANLEAEKMSKFPDPEVYCALAECASALGDVVHGVEWARAALGASGGEKAGALLARLLLATGDVEAALRAYDDALSCNACGADTLAAAGALRLRAGDPRRAFQLLGAALALQPTQHSAALALAAMMLEHKDVDAALARLKVALAAHPGCVAAHTNLGLALLAKKKYVAALTCLQRAATTAPLSARAAHDLGLALLMCRRPTSAFCRLAAAVALRPSQPHSNYSVLSRFDGPGSGSASDRVPELNTSGRTGEGREQWKHTAEHFIPAFRHPHITPQFPLHLQKINFRSSGGAGGLEFCTGINNFPRFSSPSLRDHYNYQATTGPDGRLGKYESELCLVLEEVLLLAIALERLGDTRADSAYEHAVSLAPENALIRLNLAGRHARAGRVDDAATEAVLAAELLTGGDTKPNTQLSNSLRTLFALLQEAGADVPPLSSRSLEANVRTGAIEQEKALDEV
ncbi:Bardet-Biedl syndrome 4 protein homolog [Eumeta japonica]|uniref:Bardet-Biedl syndrome 4 protein homolog n=1 Tax=Eumeta variegata TaxID=151549 RepID=A0A4C1TIL0_EUMVA|nr:Bardet-Biedl syndrome 4 protein homolog [Eumeta japonica]